MTISEYLEWSGRSAADLAREVGVSHVSVHRWLRKAAIPNRHLMRAVGKATGGRVRPEDFYRDGK